LKQQIDQYFKNLGVSKKTIRNYRSDTNHFFLWLSLKESSGLDTTFGNDLFSEYLTYLHQTKTPQRTINRRLTSLKHIGTALSDMGVLSENFKFRPRKLSVRIITDPNLVKTISVAALAMFILISGIGIGTINSPRANISPVPLPEKSVTYLYPYVKLPTNDEAISLGVRPTAYYDWTPQYITTNAQAGSSFKIYLNPADYPSTLPQVEGASVDIDKTTLQMSAQHSGVINSGDTSTVVSSASITPYSTILVTPKGDTENQVLFIAEQSDGYFVVGIKSPANHDIHFYWNAY
jgi:hypothetical protein